MMPIGRAPIPGRSQVSGDSSKWLVDGGAGSLDELTTAVPRMRLGQVELLEGAAFRGSGSVH